MARSKKFISFADHNPELIPEWHPTKNGNLSPNDVSYGSATKVWWLGKCNHEWKQSLNHRSRGRGCPICARVSRTLSRSKNWIDKYGSLEDNNPGLAKQWHPTLNGDLTPRDVTVNSSKRVYWQCEKGHSWDAPINSRNSGVGCPVCSRHRLVVGVNDLASVKPELAAQWHHIKNGEFRPTDVIAGTDTYVWWQCEKGHEWQARINNRINGNNCPVCTGKKVLVGYNDLFTIMPSLAKEWHPTLNGDLKPQDVTVGSNRKVFWKCEKGHEWQTSISHRSNGRRCPKCFGESKTSFPEQVIFYYFNQVTTTYNRYLIDSKTEVDIYLPEYKIGIEYDGAFFHKGEIAEQRENRKKEKLNRLGITLIRVREIKNRADEYTIYSKPGANDIEMSQTVKELFSCVAQLVHISFETNVDVARDRNKIYEQYIQSEKDNSLAIANPELLKEWNWDKNGALLPEFVSAHSNKKVWWRCKEGHEWQANVNTRNKGHGCKTCYNLKRTSNGIDKDDQKTNV